MGGVIMEWKAYIDNVVSVSHSPITFAGDIPNALSRWLVKSVQTDGSQIWDIHPYLDTDGKMLLPFQLAFLSTEELNLNWRFYLSTMLDRYQEVNTPNNLFSIQPNKYMYALNNVYCEQEKDILINIITYMPSPLRIWINGELVFTGTFDYMLKDYFCIYKFKEGSNTVLVESPMALTLPLSHQEFIVKLNPLNDLDDDRKKYEMIDMEFIEFLKKDYSIFPEKVFHLSGEAISVIVLPQYFCQEEQPITVTVYNAKGDSLKSIESFTSRKIIIQLDKPINGVLCLKVEDTREKLSLVYVYFGDLYLETALLLEQVERRSDCNKAIVETIKQLLEIPKAFKSMNQYVPGDIYLTIFEKIAQLQNYSDSPDDLVQKTHHEVFGSNFTVFEPKKTEDNYLAYTVHLPEGYSTGRKYPLVIYFHDAQVRFYPVDLPWLHRSSFTEGIIINMVGIGRLNYVDDINVIRKINEIVAQYNIDRNRIYGIAFCIGTYKAYRIAFEVPDLFAGLASIVGDMRLDVNHPEYEYLDNIGNTMVYGLCSTENWFFNSSRKLNFLKRLNKSKSWVFHGFMHNEFNSLHNSKILFQKLVKEKRDRIPRKINFVVLEPGYNKSHWLKVEYIEDLHIQALIKAEVRFNHLIEISTNNISRFNILVDLKGMNLNPEIEMVINNKRQTIRLSEYSSVRVTLQKDQSFDLHMTPLTLQSFNQAYDSIQVDEKLLGIKELYLKKCMIVKPDRKKEERSSFAAKLSYLLQNPMKDRYIFYQYDSIYEQDLDLIAATNSNLIYMIDSRSKSQKQEKLLDALGLRIDSSGMSYQGKQYDGDYFAFIKCENPFHNNNFILIVAFNSDALEKEVIQLMNSFDGNPLFYYDSFIFHNDHYQSFRNYHLEPVNVDGRHSITRKKV
jgi:predicted peptidase